MVAEQAVNRLPHPGLMLLAEGLGRAGVLKVRAPEEQDGRGGQGQLEQRARRDHQDVAESRGPPGEEMETKAEAFRQRRCLEKRGT